MYSLLIQVDPFQPERIMSSNSGAYTTASDVWSLGMSLLECALGRYPYSNADTVFAQLTQIIQGIAPALPEGYSLESQRFINLWYSFFS